MFNEDSTSSYSSQDNSENSSTNYSSNNGKKGFVISVGGSVFFREKPLVQKIMDFCNIINELSPEFDFVLVAGGGLPTREYIEAGKELGANNFDLDLVGISVTRTNAKLLSLGLKNPSEVLEKISDAKLILDQGKIPVFGGIIPGFTTDAVSALIAEKLGFDFINLSNVDGIYDSDPNENEDAFFFKELSYNDMKLLLQDFSSKPGQNVFLDIPASIILTRSRIRSFFLNGNHLENLKNCLRGYDFKGTIVHDIEDVIEKEIIPEEKPKKKKVKKKTIKKKKYKTEDDTIDPHEIDF